MSRKNGITFISIMIYIVLFFSFTVLVSMIVTNLNVKILYDKGDIYNSEQFLKLQQNLLVSSKDSSSFNYINGSIVFDNEDEYIFDEEKLAILKNGAILITDVEKFEKIELTDVEKNKYSKNVDNIIKYNVTLKKYDRTLSQELFILVGDNT